MGEAGPIFNDAKSGREPLLQRFAILGTCLLWPLLYFLLGHNPKIFFTTCFLLIGSALFAPASFYLIFPLMCMTTLRNHDYKKERLHKLGTELLTKKGKILYDVVLLQEFFGAFYSDRHREYFVDLMKQLGYKFHGKSSRSFFSSFPSLWANAGLAIFSPYPVKDIVARPFKNQSFYDRWMAARGIISATVSLPSDKGGDMRFFSVHVGPTVYVLSSFDFIPVFIKQMADKFALQIGEVQDEITRQAKKHNLRGVIGGDFNVRVNTEPYKFLKDRLEDIGYVCKSTEFELPGAKMTANPPGEYLLTGGTREAKILDYFFSDLPGGSSEVANMTVSHDAFNMNSDHAPIILRF